MSKSKGLSAEAFDALKTHLNPTNKDNKPNNSRGKAKKLSTSKRVRALSEKSKKNRSKYKNKKNEDFCSIQEEFQGLLESGQQGQSHYLKVRFQFLW